MSWVLPSPDHLDYKFLVPPLHIRRHCEVAILKLIFYQKLLKCRYFIFSVLSAAFVLVKLLFGRISKNSAEFHGNWKLYRKGQISRLGLKFLSLKKTVGLNVKATIDGE